MTTTVVVPIYGDLGSLLRCVDSLIAHVGDNPVLLVNDNGPQASEIESAVLTAIAGDPRFRYERNPRNLGFVGTCNRAAFELDVSGNDLLLLNSDTIVTPGFLDELSSVLHDSSEHGVVCARSNNATIASLPFELRDSDSPRTMSRTARLHAALSPQLPRYSVAPVAMGFCFLVRRELIDRFGLFDDAFAPGYGEENDFCLRVANHGYRSVIAHRALVFHEGSASFHGWRREVLRMTHERILVRRYPHYPALVQSYLEHERDALDALADCIEPDDEAPRALVDVAGEPQRLDSYRGATIAIADPLVAHYSRRYPELRIVGHSGIRGRWDVAIAVSESELDARQTARLARVSPRIVLASSTAKSAGAADGLEPLPLSAEDFDALVAHWHRAPIAVAAVRERWRESGALLEQMTTRRRRSIARSVIVVWASASPRSYTLARRLAHRISRRG